METRRGLKRRNPMSWPMRISRPLRSRRKDRRRRASARPHLALSPSLREPIRVLRAFRGSRTSDLGTTNHTKPTNPPHNVGINGNRTRLKKRKRTQKIPSFARRDAGVQRGRDASSPASSRPRGFAGPFRRETEQRKKPPSLKAAKGGTNPGKSKRSKRGFTARPSVILSRPLRTSARLCSGSAGLCSGLSSVVPMGLTGPGPEEEGIRNSRSCFCPGNEPRLRVRGAGSRTSGGIRPTGGATRCQIQVSKEHAPLGRGVPLESSSRLAWEDP